MKLFGFELAWATAAFDAVLPEGTALPHGVARLNPAATFAEILGAAKLEQSLGLRLSLWIVALAPLWILRRPRSIAGIDAGARQLVLERLLASPVYAIRQLALAFKATTSMLYARSPAARAAMTTPERAAELVVLGRRREEAHGHAAE